MIPITIPVSAQPIFTDNRFVATFNAPTIGRYDWNIAGNQGQLVTAARENSVYILDSVAFSTSIPVGDFQSSLLPGLAPALNLRTSRARMPIYRAPLPFTNYFYPLPLTAFFNSQSGGDNLLIDFSGLLKQIPATVGILTITAFVQMVIYEITDRQWIESYFLPKTREGANLSLRGRW